MPTSGLVLSRVADGSAFTAELEGSEVARARVAVGEGVWEVYSTVVLPPYEGRGIAGELVTFVLDSAEAAGVRVVPSCWYVDRYLTRTSPRYDHLRADRAPAPAADACRIAPAVVVPSRPGATSDHGDTSG